MLKHHHAAPARPSLVRRPGPTCRCRLALGLVAALIAAFKFGIALLAFLAD